MAWVCRFLWIFQRPSSRIVLLLLLIVKTAGAQEVLKTFPVSSPYSNLAAIPRVVTNENQQSWLVSWRQQNRILARIIQSDGAAGSRHTIASGVSSLQNSFDLSYDPSRNRYVLVYQTQTGLRLVFLNAGLQKIGAERRITESAESTSPQVVFVPASQNFVLLWLEGAAEMKSAVIDRDGNSGARQLLAGWGRSSGFADLHAAINPKNFNILAAVRLVTLNSNMDRAALLAYQLNASGLLSRKTPLTIQPQSIGLRSSARPAFAKDGTGFVVWTYGTFLKYRKLSASDGFSSPVKNIANAADADSANPSLALDPIGNQFVAAWTAAGKLKSAVWNGTGAITVPPFEVSQSGGQARNPDVSLDPQQGNALAVWEDSSEDSAITFQVRAGLFFPGRGAAQQNVTIGDNFFTPKNLTVDVGAIVTWTNNGFNAHTVTSGTPVSQIGMLFDSGTIGHGSKFSFRFTRTGSIPYFCRVHGAIQSGTINIK